MWITAVAVAPAACKDKGKESATRAREHAEWLAALVERDVDELARGLPEGAKRLESLVADGKDPRADMDGTRAALKRLRRDVKDLVVAKSTFFALADSAGVAIRNDLEQDVMAGQNLFGAFPPLAAAGTRPFVAANGVFPGVQNDRDFVGASALRRADGSVGAVLVSGWSYRAFGRHLRTALEIELKERQSKGAETGKAPLFYVAVFDATGVYGAPLTPAINEKAIADARPLEASAAGPATLVVEIEGRPFGLGLVRTPPMGQETGVAVLRSEL